MIQALTAGAALALAIALEISSGHFDPFALALATLAGGLAVAAALRGRRGGEDALRPRLRMATQAMLGAGAALGLLFNFILPPADSVDLQRLQGVRWLSALALLFLSAYLCRHLRGSLVRGRFLSLVALFAALGLAILRLSPHPWIDVWTFQQQGAEALLHGRNPYAELYPNIYGGLTGTFYAPELLTRGLVNVYPYPPLTLLLGLPGRLLGDVRLGTVVALVAAALLLARLGGHPGEADAVRAEDGSVRRSARTTAELAALFVLFQPRTLFVLEQAWTEPWVLLGFLLALGAAAAWLRAPSPRAVLLAGLAVGLFAASKQYSPLFLVPLALALPRAGRVRAALVALAVVAATLIPFALWNGPELWRDVVLAQVRQPLRLDALSLLALLARFIPASAALAALGFIAAALVLALTLPRRPSLAQAGLSAAAAFLAFLLFNKQAFCNYLWFAATLLAAASALREAPAPAPQEAT